MSAVFALVFARCAGFMAKAPGFSYPDVPRIARAGLALVLAIALAPASRATQAPSGIAYVFALALEGAIGWCIGCAASVLYDAAYTAGRMLDDYVGIRGAMPSARLYAPSGFGRIWSMTFTAGFFLLGGYRVVIVAFAESFRRVPAGAAIAVHGLRDFAFALPVAVVGAALAIAGPAIALALVVHVTFGILSRVIPRFSSFTLAFPVVFAAALTATLIAVPLAIARSAHPWLSMPFLEGAHR